ncbi:MAG: hypothetical protein LBI31_01055, partial [Zoogloeaceae bacterium]|nr:hypothetical protein [Zoogloeaceae bacterium]
MKRLVRWLLGTLGVALLGLLAACHFAESLFYYPARGESAQTPQNEGLAFEDVYFSGRDGTSLHG